MDAKGFKKACSILNTVEDLFKDLITELETLERKNDRIMSEMQELKEQLRDKSSQV